LRAIFGAPLQMERSEDSNGLESGRLQLQNAMMNLVEQK